MKNTFEHIFFLVGVRFSYFSCRGMISCRGTSQLFFLQGYDLLFFLQGYDSLFFLQGV